MRRLTLTLLAAAVLLPSAARSAGGHGTIGCVACHGLKKVEGTSSFCLKCHAAKDQGGRDILPITKHASHPFDLASVNPRVARVPAELVRADGSFGCLSCHDPHPSNPNYRYLRIAVGRTPTLSELCSVCHPRKADAGRATPLFTSMDERAEPSAPADRK